MSNKTGQKNTLRIIGGRWRGRKLRFPPIDGLRPTPDRVRETLFNWLQNQTEGARVLDLFAGSGALGLEALSRGAMQADFVEKNSEAAQAIERHLKLLEDTESSVIKTDVLQMLSQDNPQTAYDLVLLDPPFRQDLLAACIRDLEQHHWLADSAWVYLESEKELTTLAMPPNWTPHRSKTNGQVSYHLYHRQAFVEPPT